MFSRVCTYIRTHQVVYIKCVERFACHLYFDKVAQIFLNKINKNIEFRKTRKQKTRKRFICKNEFYLVTDIAPFSL